MKFFLAALVCFVATASVADAYSKKCLPDKIAKSIKDNRQTCKATCSKMGMKYKQLEASL